jgi:hypothetical protein
MNLRTSRTAIFAAVATLAVMPLASQSPAHRHIGHVGDGFRGTPEGMGLLPTAQAEAEIAAQHAGLAAGAGDLAGLKRHITHVMHALDPETAERGPGKGYGVIPAARGTAQHIELAASAEGASQNVQTHSNHVATSANNVAEWALAVLDHARHIQETDDLAAAKEMAGQIQALLGKIVSGHDENGDGRIGWGPSEGGLEQAATHLGLMKRGEGIGN